MPELETPSLFIPSHLTKEATTPQVVVKPLSWVKRNPGQPRKLPENDAELTPEQRAELTALGESMRKMQLQPILCQPDGTIICGERRFRAARLVGLETLEVKIADEQLSDKQAKVWALIENMARQDLTAFEKWTGCYELMCANPSWKQKDLAEALHISESMTGKLLSPSKLPVVAQDALKEEKISIRTCYAMSQLRSLADQMALLQASLNGATCEETERQGRKLRKGGDVIPPVKVQRLKCPLTSGVTIQFSSEEAVSLEDCLDAMKELSVELQCAERQGLDAKTIVRVLTDKAKKG